MTQRGSMMYRLRSRALYGAATDWFFISLSSAGKPDGDARRRMSSRLCAPSIACAAGVEHTNVRHWKTGAAQSARARSDCGHKRARACLAQGAPSKL